MTSIGGAENGAYFAYPHALLYENPIPEGVVQIPDDALRLLRALAVGLELFASGCVGVDYKVEMSEAELRAERVALELEAHEVLLVVCRLLEEVPERDLVEVVSG
jgi:hypothetical protein